MKLCGDDGEIIEQWTDATALVVIEPGKTIIAHIPQRENKRLIPEQSQIAMAMIEFLRDRRNIDWLLHRYPQEQVHLHKNPHHRHN